MTRVKKKAGSLPTDGVPPEIVQLLKLQENDDNLDRIQVQKEATPVPGRCQTDKEAAGIFETLAPNAVVCERSNEDGVDVIAQRAAVYQDIGAQLEKAEKSHADHRSNSKEKRPRKIAVSSGNTMLDQFKPWSE